MLLQLDPGSFPGPLPLDLAHEPRSVRLLGLLHRARALVEEDPSSAVDWLDRALALFAPAVGEPIEHLLVPRLAQPVLANAIVKGGLAPWQRNRVIGFIDDQIAKPLHVEAFARLCRLSHGHFCRAFKASFGETPHTYVMRQRLRHAQRLMLSTNDSLSQIACAAGLTDQAHLNRLFRKALGATPLTWRRLHRTR